LAFDAYHIHSGPLSVSIPAGASIGAFAVPRPLDTSGKINTYVLWQEASGNVQMTWEDDGSGWKGPSTPDAFRGADNGTSIACLTPSAWPPSGLEPKWDLARCYFQSNGVLREVQFDGSAWRVVGDVPLPVN
jgi:hypothetical protein